ncbi:MAG TPA: hypothetical protein VJ742_00615, partial [Nitrososphaera sp.]|nr:hypothetical protein [Nitrososphaera sp.]
MKETPLTKKVRENIPWLMNATFKQAITFYEVVFEEAKTEGLKQLIARELGRHDRFFLLIHLLKRVDAVHPWLYARCREVEQNPDDHIDLWARGHYKSSIITFAGAIQEILKDPEISIGIFSHTRPISKSFLRQIKREFESNDLLKFLYPDVLYRDPQKDSPLWSEESGIVVKRKSNPKEATVESWGLVDGQPTGKHFKLRIYDDVVTRESVTTGEQILKTTEAWELSLNLSSRPPRQWIIGTRYHFADTYKTILDRGVVKARIYPATENGTPDGKPVFLTDQEWSNKKNESGPYITACQMLLNPIAGSEQDLKPDWIRTWEVRPLTLNVYIICDPADSKEKGTSNTAMAVIGMDSAHNKYLLDGACHKMNLKERWEMLKELHKKWSKEPGIQGVYVGYEKYGMQADIQHFQQMMEIENYFFDIQEVSWTRDNINTKDDRIRRLVPDLSSWRFFFPYDGEPTKRQKEAKERGQ